MDHYERLRAELKAQPRRWFVTGVAGFIGSNLLEELLLLGQEVVGIDNFITGHQHNLDAVRESVGEAWAHFRFIEGDVREPAQYEEALKGCRYVLHQAALGSVPRSIDDPLLTNQHNVNGQLAVLWAAKEAGVERVVYASSSAVYGDEPNLPKVEERTGAPLSPYAVSKAVNELYARVFTANYGLSTVGLRYFNVFGRRQDPHGAYAAVIPIWTKALIHDEPFFVNGDGETSRDFCYIQNVVQANLLCATTDLGAEVFNVAKGDRTTLNALIGRLQHYLAPSYAHVMQNQPVYRDFRVGDVRHSHANISRIQEATGYAPRFTVDDGLKEAMAWYVNDLG